MQLAQKLSLVLLWAGLMTAAAAETPLVGPHGDFDAIVFRGNKTFSAHSLRLALKGDSELLLASHSLADLQPFHQLLRAKLLDGYLNSGFPFVKITLEPGGEGKPMEIQIEEGERYRAGVVVVKNNKFAPSETLVKRLTQSHPSREELANLPKLTTGVNNEKYLTATGREVEVMEPIWEIDEPAPFGSENSISNLLRVVFLDLGLLQARAAVRIVPVEAEKRARLEVEMLEEGKPALVEEISIAGNKANSGENIRNLIGVRKGALATQELATSVERELFNSARFRKQEARFVSINEDRAGLNIVVEEDEDVPPLGTELSLENRAALRLREWLLSLSTKPGAVLVNAQPTARADIQGAISFRDGLFIRIKAGEGDDRTDTALYVTRSTAGLVDYNRRESYTRNNPDGRIYAYFHLKPSFGGDTKNSMELGAGFSSVEKKGDPPFSFAAHIAPVSLVSSFARLGLKGSSDGGVLTFKSTNAVLKMREETGQLVSLEMAEEGRLRLAGADVFAFDEFLGPAKDFTNRYDSAHASSSFLSSAAGIGFETSLALGLFGNHPPERRRDAAAGARKILAPGTFAVFDLLTATNSPLLREFKIPVREMNPADQQNMMAWLAGALNPYVDEFFPRESWPWVLAREMVFNLKGQGKYTEAQLARLFESGEVGPIGYYTTAKFLEYFKSPSAKAFAARGLNKLSGADFQRDLQLLFQPGSPLSESWLAMMKRLGALTPGETDALGECFPGFKMIFSELVRVAKTADPAIYPAELAKIWEASGKEAARKALLGIIYGNNSAASESE